MTPLPRRTVMAGSAALAAAAAAACSPASSAPPAAPATGTTSAPAQGASTRSSAGQGTSSNTGSAPLDVNSVRTLDVPVGGGVILMDGSFVITQPTAGTFKAFSKICTHQGCPVSQLKGSEIVCTCHGSQFDITDGHVVQGPAKKPLIAATVHVANGIATAS